MCLFLVKTQKNGASCSGQKPPFCIYSLIFNVVSLYMSESRSYFFSIVFSNNTAEATMAALRATISVILIMLSFPFFKFNNLFKCASRHDNLFTFFTLLSCHPLSSCALSGSIFHLVKNFYLLSFRFSQTVCLFTFRILLLSPVFISQYPFPNFPCVDFSYIFLLCFLFFTASRGWYKITCAVVSLFPFDGAKVWRVFASHKLFNPFCPLLPSFLTYIKIMLCTHTTPIPYYNNIKNGGQKTT